MWLMTVMRGRRIPFVDPVHAFRIALSRELGETGTAVEVVIDCGRRPFNGPASPVLLPEGV